MCLLEVIVYGYGYDVEDFGRYPCEHDRFVFFADSVLLTVNAVVVVAGEIYN